MNSHTAIHDAAEISSQYKGRVAMSGMSALSRRNLMPFTWAAIATP